MTSQLKLPNLIIAGVSKAGTTSLFAYFSQHPDVCPSRIKELAYFSPLRYGEGTGPIEEYAGNFAHCGREKYRVESTPNYFYGGKPLIAEIERLLGEPRIIISLRDPVDRLWSGYIMKLRKGRLSLETSFEDYVERCLELRRDGADTRPERQLYRSVSTGFYADYASDWIEAFGERLRFIFFEQWTKRPAECLADLCGWLGIDAEVTEGFDYRIRNKGAIHRNRTLWRMAASVNRAGHLWLLRTPALKTLLTHAYRSVNTVPFAKELAPETRLSLDDLYRDANARLAKELASEGYTNLPGWLQGAPSSSAQA